MDKAKAAVSGFLNKSGHHDTSVHETISPAVTDEHVKPTRHENVTTAVDREVHQDHHHTTVQPVQHQEVLPEKHSHNVIPVEHKQHDHRDESGIKAKLEAEAAQFKDKSTTHDTKHTQSAAPVVGGEHVHHHVHETVQPIVNKETIAPEVIHTTVPVHETHHQTAKHHTATTLPAMTMDDFTKRGGALSGREERHAEHDGCPDPARFGQNVHQDQSTSTGLSQGVTGTTRSTNVGPHGSNLANKADPRVDSDMDGRGTRATGTTRTHGTTGSDSNTIGSNIAGKAETGMGRDTVYNTTTGGNVPGVNQASTGRGGASHLNEDGITRVERSAGNDQHSHLGTDGAIGRDAQSHGTETKKPSIFARLNPKKDTDGDGKAGIMD